MDEHPSSLRPIHIFLLLVGSALLLCNYFRNLNSVGYILVIKEIKIKKTNDEVDKISQRILLELESASSTDLSDARYAFQLPTQLREAPLLKTNFAFWGKPEC